MTIQEEAATVVRNLKGDAPQIANYIMQRCGEFVYDREREAFIGAFVVALLGAEQEQEQQ